MARTQPQVRTIRAFDGSRRNTIGEITLNMTMGPATFPIIFQLMDIPTSYNLLLGRPWIHMTGAVPSTLHQCLRFDYGQQKVLIVGEKGQEGLDALELIGNIEEDIGVGHWCKLHATTETIGCTDLYALAGI